MLGNMLDIGFVCEHEYRDIAMKILCDDCGITNVGYRKINGVDKVEFPGNYTITFIRPYTEDDVRGRRFDQILVLSCDTVDDADKELKFLYQSLSNSCVPEEYQIQFFTPIGKEDNEDVKKQKEISGQEDAEES